MGTNNGLRAAIAAFTIECRDHTGHGGRTGGILTDFRRNGGEDLTADALRAAGLAAGPWRLLILAQVKGTGQTPRFSARRPTDNGVVVKIRPAGNDSAVEAVLCPPRIGPTPLEAYQKLSAASEAAKNPTQPPPKPATAPPPAPKPDGHAAQPAPAQTLPSTSPLNPTDLLVRAQDRLKALSEAPKRLEVLRGHRQELLDKMQRLLEEQAEVQEELDSIAREEASLMSFDVEALAMLLES